MYFAGMKRMLCAVRAAVTVCLLATLLHAETLTKRRANQPNIIIFLVDDVCNDLNAIWFFAVTRLIFFPARLWRFVSLWSPNLPDSKHPASCRRRHCLHTVLFDQLRGEWFQSLPTNRTLPHPVGNIPWFLLSSRLRR